MATMQESNGEVHAEIGGKNLKIPRLKIRDYLDWLTELHKERKAAFTRLIPTGIIAIERYKILRNIEIDEPSPDDIVPLLYTAKGQIKVIELALKKNTPEAEVGPLIDALEAHQAKRIAFQVSGLFTADQIVAIFNPQPVAPAEAGKSEQAAPTFGDVSAPLPASPDAAG